MQIRQSGNKILLTDNIITDTMDMFGFEDYRICPWGEVRLKSRYGNWIVRWDDEVIFLWHGSDRIIKHGNERDSYHLQNVFYDLPYCIRSIKEHDDFVIDRGSEKWDFNGLSFSY